MSRNIVGHARSDEWEGYKDEDGKLLFTRYRSRNCAMLLRGGRLLAVRVLPSAATPDGAAAGSGKGSKIGAVYMGKIKNAAKNINAFFVEIADGELCFLPAGEARNPFLVNRAYDGRLLEGDELLVQVIQDAQKTKQAAVSAKINLSNGIVAVSLGISRIGFSEKLDREEKARLKGWLVEDGLCDQRGCVPVWDCAALGGLPLGLVVRTQAACCKREEFLGACRRQLEELVSLLQQARHRTCCSCIREAPSMVLAVLDQMVYPEEYAEIVTDDRNIYAQLAPYCREHLPDKGVRLYEDDDFPLSRLYSLEHKMKEALDTRVWLDSGAYLIIEATEAMTVIDVNSGKYEAKKTASEEVYRRVNREAAAEIARQLRLRNLSGIIVVDFINMESGEQELLEFLQKLVKRDKMKTRVVDITPLGLVEITRKKGYRPLREQFAEDRS